MSYESDTYRSAYGGPTIIYKATAPTSAVASAPASPDALSVTGGAYDAIVGYVFSGDFRSS